MPDRPLRAADLVPGRLYVSPSGRLCTLQPPNDNGISRTSYLFRYLTRRGTASEEDGFNLSATNATAIAALREAPVDPVFAARFGRMA